MSRISKLLDELRTSLRKVQDVERLASRVAAGSANARDLVAIKNSLSEIPRMKKALSNSREPSLKAIEEGIADFSLLRELIEKGIVDNPSFSIREGGLIRPGFNPDVDSLRQISTKGKDFIAEMELREKKRTGISSLKIGFNKVFGYYIEVTKANLDLVPEDYARKQTLVGGERFTTPELKEYENKVIGSEEKLKGLEYEVFQQILDSVKKEADLLFEDRRLCRSGRFSRLSLCRCEEAQLRQAPGSGGMPS